MTLEQIREATKAEEELQVLIKLIGQEDGIIALPSRLKNFKPIFHELNATKDGILLRGKNIVVPKALRERISAIALTGLQGIVKTKRLIRSSLWYLGIDSQIEHKVKTCIECQAMTDRQATLRAPQAVRNAKRSLARGLSRLFWAHA